MPLGSLAPTGNAASPIPAGAGPATGTGPDAKDTGTVPDDVLTTEVADGIAVVTMNRPDARNALNAALRSALHRTMAALDADDAVDAIVLTGADPAFCAGLDLKEIGSGDHDLRRTLQAPAPEADGGPAGLWPALRTPLVGAVNGVAITGGLEIALQCDFLVASELARFADTHTRVGVQPGWGLTVLLPQAVGLRRAREMSATGNFVDAATALAWGLVNHVVPHDQLLATARGLAGDIASNDRTGVRRILKTYAQGSLATGADALRLEAEVAASWIAGGGASAQEIERRRSQVVARGRSQQS